MNEVFHEGERYAQEKAGVRDKLAPIGQRLIREQLPDQHRQFYAQLPFIVVGASDETGQPWASVLANPPGFISSPDPLTLSVHARFGPFDPLHRRLARGTPLGLLGIEPHTRRRNRANGIVESLCDEGFSVSVQQSFGNCPKYITARQASHRTAGPSSSPRVQTFIELDESARALVAAADTFFIATAHPAADLAGAKRHGVDVSHRGGPPGFVEIGSDATLRVADFVGNSYFNTIGNLVLNPQAGLLFIDFETGDLLHLAVEARVLWDEAARPGDATATARALQLRVRYGRRIAGALPLQWQTALT